MLCYFSNKKFGNEIFAILYFFRLWKTKQTWKSSMKCLPGGGKGGVLARSCQCVGVDGWRQSSFCSLMFLQICCHLVSLFFSLRHSDLCSSQHGRNCSRVQISNILIDSWLIAYCFATHLRVLHSYRDVSYASEGLPYSRLFSAMWPLSREKLLSCRI